MPSTVRTVRTHQDLKQVVADYLEFDEFCFDVETRSDRLVRRLPGEWKNAENERNWRQSKYPNSKLQAITCPCCARKFVPVRGRQFCSEGCKKSAAKDKPPLDPKWNQVWCISLAGPGRSDVIPCGHPAGPQQLFKSDVFEILEPLFFSDRRKIGHNVSFDLLSTAKYYSNQIPPPPYGDTWVLYFLLNENLPGYSLDELSERFIHYTYTEKLGEKAYQVPFQEAMKYSATDAKMAWLLWWRIRSKALNQPFWDRFEQEMDVMAVLMDMRVTGAYVQVDEFAELNYQLDRQLAATKRHIEQLAGHAVNLNSTPELRRFLYDELDLDCPKATPKGQQSTDAQTLKELLGTTRDPKKREVIEAICRYKDLTKMLGTYVAGYFPHIDKDNRIRASFNLAVAKTGRLSCSRPNLQNIPARYKETFESTMVRRLFVAPPGKKLIVADYSQIELRILAHYTKDPLLLKAYREEIDLHALTASRVFGAPIDQVTKDQRFLGKTANFALAFEGGPKRLSEIADISYTQAEKIYRAWHQTYPGVRRWGDRIKDRCRDREYVRTMFGRPRRLPDINFRDDEKRSYAERQAVNFPIQGTAAEIAKIALIRVHEAISNYDAKLVLQIHDEFIIECAESEIDRVVPLVRRAMEDIRINDESVLSVPLVVDINVGDNWADCK